MNQRNKKIALPIINSKIYPTTALILIFMLLSANMFADDIKFTATGKTAVRVGEKFQLIYKINAEGKGFNGPNITNFQVLSGPNTSTNSSVQIINGQVKSKVDYIFSYILKATKDGSFKIPAARINVNGKNYTSNSVAIKVVKSSGTSKTSTGDNASTGSANQLFLRANISNTTPFQNEQVIITYRIYTNIPISNIDGSKISSFPGFWAKDLMQNVKEYPQSREMINGKEFVVAQVKKFALFPQRSGEIIIKPGELECVAQIKSQTNRKSTDPFFDSFFNDPFFNSRYQNIEKQLLSNSLKINVKPLPTQNKPANFTGAVGDFSFKSEISTLEVKANEAITLKYTLQGKGNIELIDPPNIVFPPDFEVYDPEIKNSISVKTNGVSGTRTFEYLIIPRNPGDYKIKSITFSFFNTKTNSFQKINTPDYAIKVNKGEMQVAGVTYTGIGKEDIRYIAKDIRHIKLPPFQLRPIDTFFFRSFWYNILLILPLIISVFIIIFWRQTVKRRSDIVRMKTRKATKASKKRLKLANSFLKEGKENNFYVEISRALWGYLSDKLTIPKAELSIDTVKEILQKRGVNQSITDMFIETLNNTEYARFAPGDKSENMEKIYNEALGVISKIERELK